jgi:NAD(P)-dependent dehydrogenase (short-subunit alcohol dehydrogenase family)
MEDTMSDLSSTKTIVVGASRGLGRGIASALAEAGAPVVAVSRTEADFPEPANGAGTIQFEIADAADATVAGSLIDRHQPRAAILVAGASPHMKPLQEQTWETFSVNWEADVRIAFHWLREALLRPLPPGSRMIVISSGAALAGSPLSGGNPGHRRHRFGRAGTGGSRQRRPRLHADRCRVAGAPVTHGSSGPPQGPVLVTGGTGTLGTLVVERLRNAGRQVRVLSRNTHEGRRGLEFVTGDLATGDGLEAAVSGAEIIVHCAGSNKGDEQKARRLVEAAAGSQHLV